MKDVKPLIGARCGIPGCHHNGSSLVDLTDYDNLKVYADNGRLRTNVIELSIMPPATAAPLSQKEKDQIKCWLDDGAPEN